jgi:hypothetical protein
MDAYTLITKVQLSEYYVHPFALMFESFIHLFKRRQLTASIKPPSLSSAPDTDTVTHDEFMRVHISRVHSTIQPALYLIRKWAGPKS